MSKSLSLYIYNIVVLLMIAVLVRSTSQLCVKQSNGTCLECIKQYHLSGNECLADSIDANISTMTISTLNVKNSTLTVNEGPDNNSQKIIVNNIDGTIQQLTLTPIKEVKLPNSAFINIFQQSNIKQKNNIFSKKQISFNNSFIKQLYFTFTDQIIEKYLNKISLSLFNFERMSNYNIQSDPFILPIIASISNKYASQLVNCSFQAAFYQYQTFAKIYKIIYLQRLGYLTLVFLQGTSVLDLFNTQIYPIILQERDRVTVNETVIKDILSSTVYPTKTP